MGPIKGISLTVWDIGGQEKIRRLWQHYLNNTDGKTLKMIKLRDNQQVVKYIVHKIRLTSKPIVRTVNASTKRQTKKRVTYI